MKKIAIYGAAIYGEEFCKILQKNGYTVSFFVDEYTKKEKVLNKPIYRVENTVEKDIPIFISATIKVDEIESFLKKNNFTNVISLVETFHKFPEILNRLLDVSNLWFDKFERMIDNKKLDSVNKLLCDRFSHNLLKDIIAFRTDIIPSNYLIPQFIDNQYFPKDIDIFKNIDNLKFIDCGAFCGDTIKSTMKNFKLMNKKVECIVSIEPDAINIASISAEQKRQKNLYKDTNFLTYNAAVWSKNEILKFHGEGTSGTVSNNGISVAGISLDCTVKNISPNYIKMDIEGAEKEALFGAKELIKEHSPILAICLYHRPEDLWEIPLLINEINPNYDMYLRIYGQLGLETVLYCVPKELGNK